MSRHSCTVIGMTHSDMTPAQKIAAAHEVYAELNCDIWVKISKREATKLINNGCGSMLNFKFKPATDEFVAVLYINAVEGPAGLEY